MTRVTTSEAALLCEVNAETIRKWVERGHLKPVGRRGREHVFEVDAVWAAEVATHKNDRTGRATR